MHRKNERFFTLPTILFLVAVMVMTCTATYAWYAIRKQAEEETFGFSVKVTPNLIISASADTVATATAAKSATVLSADNATQKYTPATHYDGGTTLPGLYCLDNNFDVDLETGFSDTAELIPLPTDNGKYYYRDCTVYVAATDTAIENAALLASVKLEDSGKGSTDTLSYQAASVDFYLSDTDEAHFCGTLNLAGLDAAVNDGTTKKTYLSISLPDGRIPQNTEGYITLVLRFYFDGALRFYDEGKKEYRAYVNTDTVSGDEIRFDVILTNTALSN